jgi:hypothetical protein
MAASVSVQADKAGQAGHLRHPLAPPARTAVTLDARSAAVSQRRLQALANNSPRAMQLRARIQMMQLAGQERHLPDELRSARFLLEDGAPAAEGKVGKLAFLANMRGLVSAAAQRILAPFGLAQADCPDLKYWVRYYEGKEADYIEQVIARYAPDTATAGNADDYLALLVKRIEAGLIEHTQTGKSVDPEPMPDEIDKLRPPLSVLGIQKSSAPIVQMQCASGSKTDHDDTPIVDPYALTSEELHENALLREKRAGLAEKFEPRLHPELKIYDENDQAGIVPYPYTMESVKARTSNGKTDELNETGSGSSSTKLTSYTTDLTMASGFEIPTEAQVFFRTALGSGMLLIGEVFSNKLMTEGLKMADVLLYHMELEGVQPEEINRIFIKDIVNEETVSYCLNRFSGKTTLDKMNDRQGLLKNTPFGGVLKNVIPHIINNPSMITFIPAVRKGMHILIE